MRNYNGITTALRATAKSRRALCRALDTGAFIHEAERRRTRSHRHGCRHVLGLAAFGRCRDVRVFNYLPAWADAPDPPSNRPPSFLGSGASRSSGIFPSLTGRRRPSRVRLRSSQRLHSPTHPGLLGRLWTRIQNVPPAKARRSFRLRSRLRRSNE